MLAAASRSGGLTLNLTCISLTACSLSFAIIKQGKLASVRCIGGVCRSFNCLSPLSGSFDYTIKVIMNNRDLTAVRSPKSAA